MKNIAAALVFFTRLPFWRLKAFNLPSEYYKQVINYWAVVGWLTGGVMVAVLYGAAQIVPLSVALILAVFSRLLITGALHEDGLADFFDGFGGGTSKERVLEIMKDSHIGTYGVLALILYFLLLHQTLSALPLSLACFAILAADPLCKYIASFITLFLPYARTAETSKSKVIYNKMSAKPLIISSIFGILPLVILTDFKLWVAILFPIFVSIVLILLMRKKIQGYTGDCCGALFLLSELSFYVGILIIYKII